MRDDNLWGDGPADIATYDYAFDDSIEYRRKKRKKKKGKKR